MTLSWQLTYAGSPIDVFRSQITMWGPTGQINDYATKAWGGLTRAYFKPRWASLLLMPMNLMVRVPK